jgi:hypothetical protein
MGATCAGHGRAADFYDTAILFRTNETAALVGLGSVYAGPVDEGEKVLRPLCEYGPPLVDTFQPIPYNAAQRQISFGQPASTATGSPST